MKKSELDAITALAHHEAGHAVIARKLGLEVFYVMLSLDNNGGGFGKCQHETYFVRNADLATKLVAYETDAIVALAGPVAECRYRQPTKREMAGWRGDRKTARRCVTRLVALKRNILTPEPKYDELFAQFCNKTRVLIDKHWPAIERVAQGLLDFSDLNAALVDDLIAGKAAEQFEQLIREADEGVASYCAEDDDTF